MWLEAQQELQSPALLRYVALTCTSPPVAVAQTASDASVTTSSNEDLAKLKQNPISGLRQLIFNAEVSRNLPATGESAADLALLSHHLRAATNARIGDRERTAHAVAYNSEGTVVRGHTGERTYRATFV
jgi:hypothetical protein